MSPVSVQRSLRSPGVRATGTIETGFRFPGPFKDYHRLEDPSHLREDTDSLKGGPEGDCPTDGSP